MPLGGLGEFGLNCLVVERGEDAIAIDCGVMFPEEHNGDRSRAARARVSSRFSGDRLKGIVLTHGHEDHIGALPYLLPELHAPVFATEFTAALLNRKLEEYPAAQSAQIEKYQPGDRWKLGGIDVEGLRVTHSIVDACAIAMRSRRRPRHSHRRLQARPRPIDGLTTDLDRFRALGEEGVRVLLSDSTNAEVTGATRPESAVPGFLRPIFAATKGRIYVHDVRVARPPHPKRRLAVRGVRARDRVSSAAAWRRTRRWRRVPATCACPAPCW
jgi:ribonuclease J